MVLLPQTDGDVVGRPDTTMNDAVTTLPSMLNNGSEESEEKETTAVEERMSSTSLVLAPTPDKKRLFFSVETPEGSPRPTAHPAFAEAHDIKRAQELDNQQAREKLRQDSLQRAASRKSTFGGAVSARISTLQVPSFLRLTGVAGLNFASANFFSNKFDPSKPNPSTITGIELWQEYRVIDPKWVYKLRWDVFMLLLLFFIAIVTPFEVAFMHLKLNGMYVINRVVDIFFILDIGVNFYTAYIDSESTKIIYNGKDIAKRYLASWFWVDLVSVLPYDPFVLHALGGDNDDVGNRLRVLRLTKLLRLGRLPRILKEGEIFNSDSTNFDYYQMNLVLNILGILFFSHFMACFWKLIPSLEMDTHSWLTDVYDSEYYNYNFGGVTKVYVASLYWAVMTVTTIGYGDLVPTTLGERCFCIVAMLMGAFLYGYIIAAVSNIVQQRSAKENEYYTGLTNLNTFMNEMRLPRTLQADIRQYYKRLQTSLDVNQYLHYTALLSPSLRGQMLMASNQSWIQRVQHFKGAPMEFVVEVASVLTRHLFTPRETVITYGAPVNEMFIVNKGIAAGNNRLFTIGHILGNDALIRMGSEGSPDDQNHQHDDHHHPRHKQKAAPNSNKRTYSAHAITFLECSRLDKKHLFDVLDNFPTQRDRFRILAIQSIFREEVMAYCIAMRAMKLRKRAYKYRASQVLEQKTGKPIEFDQNGDPLSPRLQDLENFDALGDEFWDMQETTRVRDLFNKTERTDFYTQKLSVLYPESERKKAAMDRAARLVQARVRNFLAIRRKLKLELGVLKKFDKFNALFSHQPARDAPPSHRAHLDIGTSEPTTPGAPEAQHQLSALAEGQRQMMVYMQQLGEQQKTILEDLRRVQNDIAPLKEQLKEQNRLPSPIPSVRNPAHKPQEIDLVGLANLECISGGTLQKLQNELDM